MSVLSGSTGPSTSMYLLGGRTVVVVEVAAAALLLFWVLFMVELAVRASCGEPCCEALAASIFFFCWLPKKAQENENDINIRSCRCSHMPKGIKAKTCNQQKAKE